MKRFIAVIIIFGLLFSAFAVTRPSIDGRAKVAEVGELPVGLFAKSASFLPGDTVIVTNPATKISIEVMIFGNIGSSEGIAVVLSPEAARELYITKGSNVIVQVTKKSDTYEESSILAKTLQTYQPVEEAAEDEVTEPVFDTPSEASDEDYYFYDDPNSVIAEEASELVIEEEPVFVDTMDEQESFNETETEIADDEPEDREEITEVEIELEEEMTEEAESVVESNIEPVDEEIAFEEPEWPAEIVEVETEPAEPVNENIVFVEPEWPAEVIETEPEALEPEEEVAFVEPEWKDEADEEPLIEYVEIIEDFDNEEDFIEEIETVLIPADPNPPVYESIIQEEPEIVIIPIFEEEPVVVSDTIESEPEPIADVIVDEEPEVIAVVEEEVLDEQELAWANIPAIEEEPVIIVEPVAIPEVSYDIEIPYGEIKEGNWYIQIATCSKLESVENIISQYGKKYPLVVVKLDSGDMRVLVGSLSADEYPTILARFKALGFKDAFARCK